jgi:predicted ABC-type ATPase
LPDRNGSGKTTIINSIRNFKVRNIPVDFGVYINADDIANELRNNSCSFSHYKVQVKEIEFVQIALKSGLVNDYFPEHVFKDSYSFKNNKIYLMSVKADERLAQIIVDFLRKKLLVEKRKFSFETVFSHPGKVEIIKKAKELGYKVYLYFVSTENPKINTFRVKEVRVKQKGHNVPDNKIISRYFRSMDLLYEASQYVYQGFFFDNSKDGEGYRLFAHFKLNKNGKKIWDKINVSDVPIWFHKYYSDKVKED